MNYHQVLANMAWTVITILSLLAFLALLWQLLKSKPNSKKQLLPPGPAGLPVIGSMHLLGKLPHRDLHRLAQKYGPIMHLRLGLVPTIVVSSARAAQLFLKDHDLVFASRPPFEAAKIISYGQKNLTFAYYGSYWRGIRKMCTLELLSNHKINSFRWMRREELNLLIESLKEASQSGGSAVNLSEKVATMSANMTCRMVFGKKYHGEDIDDRGFKVLIQEGMHLFAQPNIGNYIPQISWLDLQGLNRKMKVVGKKFDSFFEMIIDEHVQQRNSSLTGDMAQDFVDVMLDIMGSKETEYKLERDNIKAIVSDMFTAGTDTSATVIEWALSELMRHPMVLKKVQKELEDMVGLERMVEESDLEKLKYLEMVVKETLRLHPVAPLLLPHASTADCTVDGFHIPKKSHLVVNAWAIGRDPDIWQEAEKFWPERFEGSKVDVRGRDFELIPFGSGRRSCPGMQLGLTVVRLVLAQLMHCFDWELPDATLPCELDMEEEFGLVTPRAKHLFAKPSYRLNL